MKSDSAPLEVGALSETGYVREENQDRMSGIPVPLGALYIVADGMGGHKGGALAAELAVQELQRHMQQARAGEPVEQTIRAAFVNANKLVYEKAHSNDPATEGMGTTAVLLLISAQNATLAHVGDSRAYLYRGDRLARLTTDHTVVQKMVEAGMLKPEQAADHPDSSVLERAIGSKPDVEVDITKESLNQGDVILLCSDGLSGYVSDSQIESALRRQKTVKETTADLVKLALEKGGKDNVTVQLIQYGARKETPAVRQTAPVKTIPKSTTTSRHFLGKYEGRKAAAFIIAGIAAVAGLFGLYHWTSIKATEFDATKASTSKLKKELETANSAKEEAVQEARKSKEQPAAAGQSTSTITSKMQKDLQAANAAREKALKEGEELKGQLAAAKQSAKATADKMQKQLQTADAAKEKALSEMKLLRKQLDDKDLELQQAKKEIQSLTKGNKVSSAPQETTPTKVPDGSAAATGTKEAP